MEPGAAFHASIGNDTLNDNNDDDFFHAFQSLDSVHAVARRLTKLPTQVIQTQKSWLPGFNVINIPH